MKPRHWDAALPDIPPSISWESRGGNILLGWPWRRGWRKERARGGMERGAREVDVVPRRWTEVGCGSSGCPGAISKLQGLSLFYHCYSKEGK